MIQQWLPLTCRIALTSSTIVIPDSGLKPSDFVAQHAQKFIYLRFDDVRAALDFSKGAESLLVCCRAGQSRSAAVAFIIACQRFGSENADQILNAKRHVLNSWIVEMGANLLEDPLNVMRINGSMVQKDLRFMGASSSSI